MEETFNSDIEYVKNLEEQIASYKDKYIRTLAEFENYKKRTNTEKLMSFGNGVAKTILSILPVVDDFERAFNHGELAEGGQLIYKKLVNTLGSLGVEKIEINNDTKFNVDEHEAISMVGDTGYIDEVILPGYKLDGKVIRFAKVIVC